MDENKVEGQYAQVESPADAQSEEVEKALEAGETLQAPEVPSAPAEGSNQSEEV